MAIESAKVRLVRCPKCDNLLPELADYSVYQCGGCGAVLTARKNSPETDNISDGEVVEDVSVKLNKLSESVISNKSDSLFGKVMSDSSDAHEANAKIDGAHLENNVVLKDHDEGKAAMPENYNYNFKATAKKCVVDNDLDIKMHGKGIEELKTQIRARRFEQSVRSFDRRIGERREMEKLQTKGRNGYDDVKTLNSNYPDEGPSVNYTGPGYGGGYESTLKDHNGSDGFSRVEYLEQDRADLLRKLDELKDQLNRSCTMAEKPKDKVPLDGRTGHQDPYGSTSSNMQFFAPDRHVAKPPYNNHYPELYPFVNGHESGTHSLYPASHNIPNYIDPVRSQMFVRDPHQVPCQYQLPPPPHPYFSEPYPLKPAFHHPSCSRFCCYDEHLQIPSTVKRFPNLPNNPTFYNHNNPNSFSSRDCNARIPNPPQSSSHAPRQPLRWPRDLDSDMDGGVICNRYHRAVLAKNGRRCRPVASGAPFITCWNCSELLQLPIKLAFREKSKQKMQCGSCSAVLVCSIVHNKFAVSAPEEMEQIITAVSNSSDEIDKHSNGHLNQATVNFYSDEFDSSGYDSQSMDMVAPMSPSKGHDIDSAKIQETHSLHSSSATLSENEDSPNRIILREEVTVMSSDDQPLKATVSPPLPGSPLQEYFNYSSNNQPLNRLGKGNQSSRSDHEKVLPNTATSRQNSIKDVAVATEMDVSFNEYSDISKEEDIRPKTNKGSKSFLAGVIKKSFRSNHAPENGKSTVSVNGYPLPDRLIKKAEKLAGPIHPGQYWYDFRAGFWGVNGGPCLGIIPPYIEEFNHPMSKDCAGGNTGVIVNGRELHKRDLELLASRGLPPDRDRSYIIDISGRVLDEESGKELDGLGKLAPTVEKVKHGFGMKAPPQTTAAR